jgi:hypothetical protein
VSAGWAKGSTRAWRRLRLAVLNRDGWRCRMLAEDGHPCGRQLRPKDPRPEHRATVEHLDPLSEGHPLLAPMDRLRAACATHNAQGGAAMTNANRVAEPDRGWAW